MELRTCQHNVNGFVFNGRVSAPKNMYNKKAFEKKLNTFFRVIDPTFNL